MKKILLISIVFIVGCGYWASFDRARENRKNLNNLQIGMSKEQVREIAGEPYQTKAKANNEIWLYATQIRHVPLGNGNFAIEAVTTPLLFEDNKLVSWGQGIAEPDDVEKYELRIR